ncbi:MAG: tail sheath stabilizer and completion protein [Flavobacterium sp.]|uniref:tail sheath stabilizer and completion protein n=1 Tax=Flavobacterium sp. TaxID=239 RepID=UPI00262E4255|nr:tail sheath stabilizer and completion protein [Flavobacterium sp.]MDD5149993.1 tail sheath stabilizer and completion protein [Flavobacterium sp.]
MARPVFYNQTIKNCIVAFATIFNDIRIITEHNEEITVPLHYAPKEKFVSMIDENVDLNVINIERVLPRMGFELTGLLFDSTRFSNPLNRMIDVQNNVSKKYMFSRVPYNLQFTLYIATKKFETALQIVEQIFPFFVPELNITVRDKEDFNLFTDIPVTLDSSSFSIEYEGTFEEKRRIEWEMNFTLKAWLYGDVKQQERIKKTIIDFNSVSFTEQFDTLVEHDELDVRITTEFVPPDTIIETITKPSYAFIEANIKTGEELFCQI